MKKKIKKIQALNEEIQNLQFENLHLVNRSDMQNELNQANFNDMEKLIEENNRYIKFLTYKIPFLKKI